MKKEEIYAMAIAKWGEELQIGMVYEEMGELMKAINKMRRNTTPENEIEVLKEIADVRIMLEQLAYILKSAGGEEAVNQFMDMKLTRLKSWLGEGE